jgi:phage FluMu gp28-like protein
VTPAIPLYPYQRRWIADHSRFKLGMFARQTGKTFTTTLEIVDDCVAKMLGQGRGRWVILSRGERQAAEAIEEGVKRHASAYGVALKEVATDLDLGEHRSKALEVLFPGGGRVTALPANPDTARGFSADLFLDEFAFHAKSRAIWSACFPIASSGGKRIRITSTGNGKGNVFYGLATGKDGAWSRHFVDIYQAVADGLPRDIPALREALNDEDAWAQEFELKWLDEASAWISYELIDGAEAEGAGQPEGYQGGPCFVGVDIGRRRDLFVIYVLERVGDVLVTREVIPRQRATFAEQDALLDKAFQRYRVIRCCMDQTGIGEKPVEDAQRRHGMLRVEGVLFTSANKLTMATLMKEAFQERRLRLPPGDRALRADIHSLRQAVGATGVARFVVAEDETDGHADRAWALALAIAAADQPVVRAEHLSSGQPRASAGLTDYQLR